MTEEGRCGSLGSSVVDLQALEDVAECPVCTEIEGTPKVLPCLHTVCLACITRMLADTGREVGTGRGADTLSCPLCREEVHMPLSGPPGLPTNYTVLQLREALKFVNQSGKVTESAMKEARNLCEICRNKQHMEAVAYCKDCAKHVCHQCATAHTKRRVFANHVIVHTNDSTILCLNHKERFKYVCVECNRLLCIPCVAEDICPDHDIQEITSVAPEKAMHMKDVVDDLETHIQGHTNELIPLSWQLEEEIEFTNNQMELVTSHIEAIIKQAQEDQETMVGALRERQRHLVGARQALDAEQRLDKLRGLKDAAYAALRLGPEHIISALPNIKVKITENRNNGEQVETAKQLLSQRLKFDPTEFSSVGVLSTDLRRGEVGIEADENVEKCTVLHETSDNLPKGRQEVSSSYRGRRHKKKESKLSVDYSLSPTPWWSVKELLSAWDVALMSKGRVAVTDQTFVKLFEQGNAKASHSLTLRQPKGICYNEKGKELLVVDNEDCKVYFLNEKDLSIKKSVQLVRVVSAFGIGLLKDGTFVISDHHKNEISIHNDKGKMIRYWGRRGVGDTHFTNPCYLVVDRQNRIIIADSFNHCIKVFDHHGRYQCKLVQSTAVASPRGLCEDSKGNVLVCSGPLDGSTQTLTGWSPEGVYLTTVLERSATYVASYGTLSSVDMRGDILVILSNRSMELYKWKL